MSTALIGLRAETSIHAGAGASLGAIDLPIQREHHGDWPVIFGSSIKGAWREMAERQWTNDDGRSKVASVFGPETTADGHGGALLPSDARLLLLPVRSLTTQFRWVTCPWLLRRFVRDCQRFGQAELANFGDILAPGDNRQALVPRGAAPTRLMLAEFLFNVEDCDLSSLICKLAALLGDTQATPDLTQLLTIVSDDRFRFLARYCTPVDPHVKLESNKTVASGALWYEETLPPETIMYICAAAEDERAPVGEGQARRSAMQALTDAVGVFTQKPYFRVGGNETVGMGWFKTTVLGMGG
ncbi:MAG: type III-B CRISPR module RAMP protein Cmr4 [Burkholderiales bacterium]